MSGRVLVLSGPSGAGKSTIIKEASSEIGDFYFSVSTTTRAPRDGEVYGREYYFVTKEEFEKGIKNGDFLEYALVHGNYYGTSLKPVKEALKNGKLVIFDIDVQGHRLVKKALGSLVSSIFITPPSLSELKKRLLNRSSDDKEVINKRLENAKEEIEAISEYDFVIINDDIKKAAKEFVTIINATKCKIPKEDSKTFIQKWLKS